MHYISKMTVLGADKGKDKHVETLKNFTSDLLSYLCRIYCKFVRI